MKKTIISLAAASLVASSAMAADKGIEFTTTGQAVVYYQTAAMGDNQDLFSQEQSVANVGIQLNNNADLGNGFAFGSQLSYLGTAGLEKQLVHATMQTAGALYNTTDEIALTKIYVAKKVANTTVKIGRQELPKSLSPLAFTEGYNVFKNTYEAVVVINTDIPNTTLVGASVGKSTGADLGQLEDLKVNGAYAINGAYMLTAVNTALPMTTLTGSFYALTGIDTVESANALWVDAKIADKSLPMGMKIGLQGGTIMPENSALVDTTAFGVKVGAKPMPNLTVCGAFTMVDDGTAAIVNTGTNVKTPLYTQMVANQGAIKSDNSTMMLKGAYALGDMGTVIAQSTLTTDNSDAANDNTELDLIYTTKLAGATVLAAYVYTKNENDADANNIVRVWARYAF